MSFRLKMKMMRDRVEGRLEVHRPARLVVDGDGAQSQANVSILESEAASRADKSPISGLLWHSRKRSDGRDSVLGEGCGAECCHAMQGDARRW
jgi:hypothetical protein